ncbi:MAG TPA: insulinase family protein [Bacteroidia bacterium]|jgi:predicted Zn-dependent peptidase|nr:insulinase family protein [Bacteroidia bacterium]
MKQSRILFFALLCLVINFSSAQKKDSPNNKPLPLKDGSAKPKLNFETATNDPYKTRIYTLSNGMKVYMSVYKDAPRIQTLIAVKSGSKNDPADATGLAHYLEHMVFKGTDEFGTKDFAKENEQINKVENLYEVYRGTKDEAKRKIIYHQIDSISGVAAKYAIANEYDKMLSAIGAQGTNAFTSFDETVYINDIPNNQIDNWLKIESERFRKPVLRLFHTELEAVYEEKNRTLDNDNDKAWDAIMAGLFQKHSYGTQTTIGTIDHLKNPSMKEIMKFYDKNYVPNNMAIIMSGDFDPDKTILEIEKNFGKFSVKPIETYKFEKEAPITSKIVKEIVGPEADNLAMAWRFNGAGSRDADMISIINLLLWNNRAGLMDINLNQAQKVINAGAFAYILKDYSVHAFFGSPKTGQTLEEVEKLILQQIELIKKGEFPDWLLGAAITELKLQKTKELEDNGSRAMAMLNAFKNDISWQDAVNTTERLSKITKKEIMEFAKANYNNNYVIAYKRMGEDKNIEKVEKPAITPVEVDRENSSPFVKNIVTSKTKPIEPKYIDYDKDILKLEIKPGLPFRYTKNTENSTFDLIYVFDMGTNNDKQLKTAIDCVPYLGTSDMSPAQVKEELFKLGCSFNVSVNNEQTIISLNGLSDNFEKALAFFENILNDPKLNEETLKNLVSDVLKKRIDAKQNKSIILNSALNNYAKYGANNPFTYVLSETELNKLTVNDITEKIKNLSSLKHHILYYGSLEADVVKNSLISLHKTPVQLKDVPPEFDFKERPYGGQVYFVDYPMKQVEIVMLSDGNIFNQDMLAVIALYNSYFGGSMSGVVFQDLRESKALAYSAYSEYIKPRKPGKKYTNFSYIGSQADKLTEALKGMSDLLSTMPRANASFNSAKEQVLQEIESQRITKSNILLDYEKALKFGYTHDIRKDIFDNLSKMTFEDVKKFQETNIKGKPFTTLVVGDKSLIDQKVLEKYGPVKTLSLQDIFGY